MGILLSELTIYSARGASPIGGQQRKSLFSAVVLGTISWLPVDGTISKIPTSTPEMRGLYCAILQLLELQTNVGHSRTIERLVVLVDGFLV